MGGATSSSVRIMEKVLSLYDRIANPSLLVRRLNISASALQEHRQEEGHYEQMDLFTDYEALEEKNKEDEKEHRAQEAALQIQQRFGKNALLKGMNLQKEGTTRQRNEQVGGHRG